MNDVQADRRVPSDLVRAVLLAYREFLLHQGAAASTLVRWTRSSRSLDFAWLGGTVATEALIRDGQALIVESSSPLFPAVRKMKTTSSLNPYEREVLYGYPFVVGRKGGKSVRGPLLTIPATIVPHSSGFAVHGDDEFLRFNALPFKTEDGPSSLALAIARVLDIAVGWPAGQSALEEFLTVFFREFPGVEKGGVFDGRLDPEPAEPTQGEFLRVIDQAALFVAPKSNYFLASDLELMANEFDAGESALLALLEGSRDERLVEFSESALDGSRLVFPFSSNRAQRKVALLLDDPTTSVVRVEGPPGTGKSLTIANLACHLGATGRSVLITSQKDKALKVVDAKLRELGIPGFPMTLLRQDKEAKRELLERLADAGSKTRSSLEVEEDRDAARESVDEGAATYLDALSEFETVVGWEEKVATAMKEAEGRGGLGAILARRRARRTLRRANRVAPRGTDEIADDASGVRADLASMSRRALGLELEHSVATATRGDKQHLRELQDLLKRDQKSAKNYPLFDRLKAEPDRATTLLGLLPVWIMAPDDVARLFPAHKLFDVVIVDEASQVDLPSIFPVLYRAEKLVVSGDTKQMQPKRFAFTARSVVDQAWQGVLKFADTLVPLLSPSEMSLLQLAEVRAQEENLLDEHFRSLPPIIDFSNERWYRGRLRVMTDERRKKFGTPDQPLMQLHHVASGRVSNESQENEEEAKALVALLEEMVINPDYQDSSIGILCLFEEQVELVQELVAQRIDEAEWVEHQLVVVNPDGFQGDERDVILYSLSYDAGAMPRAALSARQQDSPHVQGMLNVAFTRARDEIHVFHSAPIGRFFKEDGTGAIGDWLAHINRVESRPRKPLAGGRQGRIDSEFEADVADELRKRGVTVTHQYPACGFFIDLMCELNDVRVGVECDGPTHFDEHGRRRVEDLERLAVLARAGWTIVNIPYRKWLREPGLQLQRVMEALEIDLGPGEDGPERDDSPTAPAGPAKRLTVGNEQHAIFEAVRSGLVEEDDVLRKARDALGRKRLTSRLRQELRQAAFELNHRGLLVVEEGEYFLTPAGRSTVTQPRFVAPAPKGTAPKRSRKPGRRATANSTRCGCGGRWVLRNGRYGKFYGCSRYPRCRRSKPYR